MRNLLLLKEKALANILLLFDYWKLQYIRINDDEYDFINPTRQDNNFGACRFNIKKGLGADFTGASFSTEDFQSFGMGFSREDFNSFSNGKPITSGFDIIGLVQRLHNCATYRDAADLLDNQLCDLSKIVDLENVSLRAAIQRQQELEDANLKRVKIARKTWDICQPIQGTLGETYLNSRMIFLEKNEPTIRFHKKIWNRELGLVIPAILLKCSISPNSQLEAIHRIYLDQNGKKAPLLNAKLALGNIKGLGIWFGSTKTSKDTFLTDYTLKSENILKNDTLAIVEGPENALTIRSLGYNLVCSTINATNFCNITIPEYIKKIHLFPDGDKAGRKAADKAYNIYKDVVEDIYVHFPPVNPDNPKWDWNDELQLRGKNVGRQKGG